MKLNTNTLKVMLKVSENNDLCPYLSCVYYSKSCQTVFVTDGAALLLIKPINTKFDEIGVDFVQLDTNSLKSAMAINKEIDLDQIGITNIDKPKAFIEYALRYPNPEKQNDSTTLNTYNPNYLMSATKIAKAYKVKLSYPEYIKNSKNIGI